MSVLGTANVLCASDEEGELPHKSLYTNESKRPKTNPDLTLVRLEMPMLGCRWILFCSVAPVQTVMRGKGRALRKEAPGHG